MTMRRRTNDFDIRALLVRDLLRIGVPRAAIRHEITLNTSSSDGRADVALALDHALIGIEIKSGSDTLGRLDEQKARYSARFDLLALVHDARHEKALLAADSIYGWGCLVSIEAGAVRPWRLGGLADLVAPGSRTHRSTRTSPFAMLELLWATEVRSAAARLGLPHEGARHRLIDRIGDRVSLTEIRREVVVELRHRGFNRWEDAFWKRYDALPAPQAVAA